MLLTHEPARIFHTYSLHGPMEFRKQYAFHQGFLTRSVSCAKKQIGNDRKNQNSHNSSGYLT